MKQLIETRLQKLILITTVLLLAGLVAAPLVLAQTQNWYLTNTVIVSPYQMDKGTPDAGDSVPIAVSSTTTWIANDYATTNVSFPAATWSGSITMTAPNVNKVTFEGYVQLGVFTPPPTNTFTPIGPQSNTMTWAKRDDAVSKPYSISAPVLSVPQDDYLAIQFVWTGTNAATLITNSGSYVAYPVADPAYPVPDIKTWILFTAGLGVIGFVFWRLRQKHTPSRPAPA